MSDRFAHTFRVRYVECDPQGIVSNINYLAYIDHAVTELWREAFGSYGAMTERGIDMVVAELNLQFHGSARFDDLVTVSVAIKRLGNTGMTADLWLHREDELLVEATIRHVYVDTGSWEKTEIPAWLRQGLEPYLDV